MRIPFTSPVAKSVLAVAPLLLASPALAQEAGGPVPAREWERRGSMFVELQPPALDGSLYGARLDISPYPDAPFTFGLLGRVGGWSRSLRAQSRFEGTDRGEAKLNYAVGADGRLMLGSFGNGAWRPFVGLSAGFEEFVVRTAWQSAYESATTSAFLEPTLGLMWRPGGGRVGLSGRVGPGITFTDTRELAVEAGDMRLRKVYPNASLSLLVVL